MYMMLSYLGMKGKGALARFRNDERGEVNIVAIVVLIGIAVLLAIVFKDNIIKLLNSLFITINNSANNAIK